MRGLWAATAVTLALGIGIAGSSCNTPTLPIPPPVGDVSAPGTTGFAIVTGTVDDAQGSAYILAFNIELQHGELEPVTVTGYRVEIEADAGNTIRLYGLSARFEIGQPVDLTVPAP